LQKQFFGFSLGTREIFIIGYCFIFVLTTTITYAIFYSPQGFRKILIRIFSIRFLKRWRRGAIETGNDIIVTSTKLKGENTSFWLKAFGATFFSWTARFWVVNFLILAITSATFTFGE